MQNECCNEKGKIIILYKIKLISFLFIIGVYISFKFEIFLYYNVEKL